MSGKRKYWGWGNVDVVIDASLIRKYKQMLMAMFQVKETEQIAPVSIEDLVLRGSRFELPNTLKQICSAGVYDRASHSYGKSFRDICRGLCGIFDNPPDYVAYPKDESDITSLIDFATAEGISLIPYGGGSSVTGGVEPTESDVYRGTISVDMKHFDKVLQVDKESRSAQIQAGIFGPALEAQLKPHGLTLRHYPQSFEFSTLGGWIATRSGGHFATLYTHIDEFVQSVRMITPQGALETRRSPGHGAGPQEERLVSGSEGIFGIITSAWMRLQDIPKYKVTKAIKFADFWQGVEATRQLAQSGLFPANARLVDPMEAFSNGLGDGQSTVVIVGFESHHHPVDQWLQEALSICKALGGQWEDTSPTSGRSKKADAWKNSFLQAPYLRDEIMKFGFIMETFETSVTWDQFESFHKGVKQAALAAITEHCGAGTITCRFTHLYPDGPAPYYTIIAKGSPNRQIQQWDAIKAAVSQAIIAHGGSITHHHAVGKDHQPYYEQQHSEVFGMALRAVKDRLDPKGIFNPGVLLKE